MIIYLRFDHGRMVQVAMIIYTGFHRRRMGQVTRTRRLVILSRAQTRPSSSQDKTGCHDPNPGSMTGNVEAVQVRHHTYAKFHDEHIKRASYLIYAVFHNFHKYYTIQLMKLNCKVQTFSLNSSLSQPKPNLS
jgi:hypothetical protein